MTSPLFLAKKGIVIIEKTIRATIDEYKIFLIKNHLTGIYLITSNRDRLIEIVPNYQIKHSMHLSGMNEFLGFVLFILQIDYFTKKYLSFYF